MSQTDPLSPDSSPDASAEPAATTGDAGVPVQPAASSQSAPPSVSLPDGRRHHDRFRELALIAAAAIVGVAFGAGMMSGLRSPATVPAPSGLASASLAPRAAAAKGASGSAQLLLVSGEQVLRVRVTGMLEPTGFYEVWLYDPSADKMVAIGTLGSSDSVDLPVPAAVDPRAFHVVDISAQPLNGDPSHGQSMLQGSLH